VERTRSQTVERYKITQEYVTKRVQVPPPPPTFPLYTLSGRRFRAVSVAVSALYPCGTVDASIHIGCHVHTNDYFFDTSREPVDGVDTLPGCVDGINICQ
jgi:hypothetical protein